MTVNILHLRSSEFMGGPERAVVGQCQAMRNHSFICASFVQPHKSNEFLDVCASRSIRTYAIPQRGALDFIPARLLRQAVSEHGIDILVSHDYKSNMFGALALRGLPIPQVAHFRGRTDEDAKVRLYNLLDRFVLRGMDRVFVVCRAARDQLVNQGIDARSISVVPNGFDCTVPLRSLDEVRAADTDLPVQIIAAGRLSKEKGFDILVAASELLSRAGHKFHVRIYGSGPEQERLQVQIAQAGVERHVRLMGFARDLAARMREANILVIPSRSEGMPNVLLEAWAAGLAVVATPVGGVPEMIDQGINGILSDQVTPASLSTALSDTLKEPQLLQSLGLQGQAKLKSHFSFEKQAELLDHFYHEVDRIAAGVQP